MSIVRFDGDERALHGDIRLDGLEIDMIVGDALVGFDEELAVDGSSIIRVSVLDSDCELEWSGLLDLRRDDDDQLGRETELIVDGVAYWLRQVVRSPEDDVVQLVFEDREICRMRDTGRPAKVSARTHGVRGFIRRLCVDSGAPEPITNAPTGREAAAYRRAKLGTYLQVEKDRRDRDRRRKPGIADGARLRVKGAWATDAQLSIAARLLSVANEMGAGPKATLALILAGIVESVLSNPRSPSADGYGSYGVLQARVGVSRGARGTIATIEEACDVEYMAESFLINKAGYGFTSKGGAMWQERNNPHLTAGQIAQAVEGSAYPDRYDQYQAEGRAIVSAFFGGDLPLASGLSGTITTVKEAPLTVERGESNWDAAMRIADSYNARFFVVANQPYFLFDDVLMRSRPVLTIANPRHPDADPRRTRGVIGVGWEWAPRKQLRRTDLVLNVREVHAPPGSVVLLDETCGPAGSDENNPSRGRWLIGRYERDRFQSTARLTAIKGRRPRVPTETETESFTIGGTARDRTSGGVRVGKGGTTSPFGGAGRYPISDTYGKVRPTRIHMGLDVAMPVGTPCIAPFDGVIKLAERDGFSGGGIIHIQSPVAIPSIGLKAGDILGWGHVSRVDVRVGQKVTAGTVVGASGTAGSGPHVHFIRQSPPDGRWDGNADPTAILRALGGLS